MCLAPFCSCKIRLSCSTVLSQTPFLENRRNKKISHPISLASRSEIQYCIPASSQLRASSPNQHRMTDILSLDNCQQCDDALFIGINGEQATAGSIGRLINVWFVIYFTSFSIISHHHSSQLPLSSAFHSPLHNSGHRRKRVKTANGGTKRYACYFCHAIFYSSSILSFPYLWPRSSLFPLVTVSPLV